MKLRELIKPKLIEKKWRREDLARALGMNRWIVDYFLDRDVHRIKNYRFLGELAELLGIDPVVFCNSGGGSDDETEDEMPA